ncbi:MAG: hypothetical protein ABJH68_12955 [Ilumatobacter sp.]|uniref:hypothetical protein n=1 Tax=Ilumatobacter sp. TaxID=1967498 RepID=UPI00329911D6
MSNLRVTALGIAVVAVLAACGGGSSPSQSDEVDDPPDASVEDVADEAPGSTEAPETTEPAETPVETTPEEDEVAPRCAVEDDGAYSEVSCDEPHDAEFAALVGPPDGVSPTDEEEFDDALRAHCVDAVVELTGRDANQFGFEVGATTTDQPGATFAADVECWAEVTAEGTLTASLRDVSLEVSLGDNVIVGDIVPGNCFLFVDEDEDSFDIGRVADCEEQYAEMVVGIASSDVDTDDYPGEDAVVEIGDRVCGDVAGAADFELSGDTVSFIYPLAFEWEERGIRDLICTSYRSSDFEEGGDAFCATKIEGGSYEETECDQPHDMEFVGPVEAPAEILPADYDEAVALLTAACSPLVSDYLGGRDLSQPGVGVTFDAEAELGEPIVGDVDCFVLVSSASGLSAAISDVGFDAALGDLRVVSELDPGTCFVNPPDSFELGTVVPCDAPDALLQIGQFVVEDGPYPGEDPLRAIRGERCPQVLAESGLADLVDVATLSGVFPNLEGWRDLGRRSVTCDASPL